MNVKETLIAYAVQALVAAIPPTVLVEGADRLLDLLEDLVAKTETPVDDAIVGPLVKAIRTAFHIEDRDPAPVEERVL